MPTFISLAIPFMTFLLVAAVGLDLRPEDFARVRRQRAVVLTGLVGPLLLLPPVALSLIAVFRPPPAVQAGLLLIAACPIGGISNTYSYLARASTALSVTLTALSCLLAVVTIPALASLFEVGLGRAFGFTAPIVLCLFVNALGYIICCIHQLIHHPFNFKDSRRYWWKQYWSRAGIYC